MFIFLFLCSLCKYCMCIYLCMYVPEPNPFSFSMYRKMCKYEIHVSDKYIYSYHT